MKAMELNNAVNTRIVCQSGSKRSSPFWPVSLITAAIVCAAWLTVDSDEKQDAAKPQASAGAKNKALADNTAKDNTGKENTAKEIVSGKVVMLADALKRHGIKNYAEESKGQVVLETERGELIPIVSDWRGRAFFQDERLRDRPVDLLVNRRPGIPWVQVLSIYTFDEQGVRNITDYWCDICAIPMYEIKECECCQGPIRLRFRPQDLPPDVPKHTLESSPKIDKPKTQ